jgi:hypothetical protein
LQIHKPPKLWENGRRSSPAVTIVSYSKGIYRGTYGLLGSGLPERAVPDGDTGACPGTPVSSIYMQGKAGTLRPTPLRPRPDPWNR